MRMRWLVGILIFLIVVNLAAIGTFLYVHFTRPERGERWAREGRSRMHEGRSHGEQPFAKLSKEERRAMFDMMREFREASRDEMEQTRALEREMFELLREESVDKAQVDSLVEEITAIRLQVAKDATARLLEMRENLTPEQREQLLNAFLRMHRAGDPRFDDRPPRDDRRP